MLADELGVDPSADAGRGAPGHPARRAAAPRPAGQAGGQPGRPRAGLAALTSPRPPGPVQPARPADQLRRARGGAGPPGRAAGRVAAGHPDRAGRRRQDPAGGGGLGPAGRRLADGVWFVPSWRRSRDAADVPQAVLTALGAARRGLLDPAEAARLAALAPAERLADALAGRRAAAGPGQLRAPGRRGGPLAGQLLRRAARGCASWPPAGSRWASPARRCARCRRWRCRRTDRRGRRRCGYPAVRLFADRAAAVRPGFAVDHGHVGAGGPDLPGAGRAAAGHRAGRGPAAVADRRRRSPPGSDDRFRLLTGGSRTALPRHRTLRAVVDWSWDLLDDAERAAAGRRLAVFPGGATPRGAERCARWPDRGAVVDLLAALVDKSLVTRRPADEVRYRMLETIRAYARGAAGRGGRGGRGAGRARRLLRWPWPSGPSRQLRGARPAGVAGPADRRARQLRGGAAVRHRRRRRGPGTAAARGADVLLDDARLRR